MKLQDNWCFLYAQWLYSNIGKLLVIYCRNLGSTRQCFWNNVSVHPYGMLRVVRSVFEVRYNIIWFAPRYSTMWIYSNVQEDTRFTYMRYIPKLKLSYTNPTIPFSVFWTLNHSLKCSFVLPWPAMTFDLHKNNLLLDLTKADPHTKYLGLESETRCSFEGNKECQCCNCCYIQYSTMEKKLFKRPKLV